ncbi:hypothetical protein E2C01_065028 [Portunus trituberculatus]|uniref:Uncharacterized protein n=1 Tax=Portunus trituberculatus TaxID=210409 RepID=A0A5B7HHS4_PORTR|nr:hypothetical protein [Portunus trituberculatus]
MRYTGTCVRSLAMESQQRHQASCCLGRHLAGFTITCHPPRATGRFTPLPGSKNTTFPSKNVWPSRDPRRLTTH